MNQEIEHFFEQVKEADAIRLQRLKTRQEGEEFNFIPILGEQAIVRGRDIMR